MGKYLFVLGAGASADSGVPMMGNFLERAEDLLRLGKVDSFKNEFELALKARAHLSQTHSKATCIDIYNMEAVFSAFEMAQSIKRLGGMDAAQIEKLPSIYRLLISKTIEHSMIFPVVNERSIGAPSSYGRFGEILKTIDPKELSILTFNYDIAIDYALRLSSIKFDYCLEPTIPADSAKLLKLHGSLNWGEREVDNKIYAAPIEKFFTTNQPLYGRKTVTADISNGVTGIGNREGVSAGNAPIIVPPTWNKTNHNKMFENIWKHAADSLNMAEHIFVIGYSLPESDQFFKYLYALGTAGETVARTFWVFDPEPAVEARFKNLLSPSMLSRFKFLEKRFDEAIDDISYILPQPNR